MKAVLQRTQINLPKDLREEIDKQRSRTGETLAQYLRKAAEERLKLHEKKKVDLKKLAEEVIGSIKAGKQGLRGVNLKEWHKERRMEDGFWIKRWDETVKSASRKKTSQT